MADLATQADVEARLGRTLTGTEVTRCAAYLKDASAAVRKYTRQTFGVVASDTAVLRPTGMYLILQQLPVTAVHAVASIDEDGNPLGPLTGWRFDGIDRIDITGSGSGLAGDPWWPWTSGPDSFQVTYDHGDPTTPVPDDVIGIVCGMVLQPLLAPTSAAGLNSERIGEYSYGYQQGGTGSPGPVVRLSEQDKLDLKDYRPQAGSIQVRL